MKQWCDISLVVPYIIHEPWWLCCHDFVAKALSFFFSSTFKDVEFVLTKHGLC